MAIRWTDEQIIQAMLDWEAIIGERPKAGDWDSGWAGEYPSSHTVRAHFGTWQAALDAAWPPVKRRRPARLWPRERIISELQRWARDHDGLAPSYNDMTPANDLPSVGRVQDEFGSMAEAVRAAGLVQLPTFVNKQAVRKYLPLPKRSD